MVAGDYITSVGFVGDRTLEKVLSRWTLITGMLFFALLVAPARAEPPQRVLFVGNSFTYYNNSLHSRYRAFRAAASEDGQTYGRVRVLAISGGALPEQSLGLQQRLEAEDWDVVVLQGHSKGPITDGTAEPFQRAARRYAIDIRADGAEPVFFMTWAYTGKPEMTQQLDDAYTAIGNELNAKVVPVGRAFASALQQRPELALVIPDLKHPTLAGTYLATCVFFAALHGESPVGVSYTAGLSNDDALFLQQVAWDSWKKYSAN